MDALLHKSTLSALRALLTLPPTTLKSTLPLPISTFFSTHMHQNRPHSAPHLDMKLSSYGKLVKWMKLIEKRGWIKLKDLSGKGGEVVIWSIHSEACDDLKTLEKFRVAGPDDVQELDEGAGDAGTSEERMGELVYKKLYFPHGATSSIMASANAADADAAADDDDDDDQHVSEDYLEQHQVRDRVLDYIKRHHLADPSNQRFILPDALLSSILPSSTSKWTRDAIIPHVLKNMKPHYILYRLTPSPHPPVQPTPSTLEIPPCHPQHLLEKQRRIRKGLPPQVHIQMETRAGRKVMTRITQLEGVGIDPHHFSKYVQTRFATSSTVHDIVSGGGGGGVKKGGPVSQPEKWEVMVQGAFGREVVEILNQRYGVPEELTQLEDKSKPKKTKKR